MLWMDKRPKGLTDGPKFIGSFGKADKSINSPYYMIERNHFQNSA